MFKTKNIISEVFEKKALQIWRSRGSQRSKGEGQVQRSSDQKSVVQVARLLVKVQSSKLEGQSWGVKIERQRSLVLDGVKFRKQRSVVQNEGSNLKGQVQGSKMSSPRLSVYVKLRKPSSVA